MSKALLSGAFGGIIGTITAVVGIIWIITGNTFINDTENFSIQLTAYLNYLIGAPLGLPFIISPIPPLIYPSDSSFYIFSFLLVVFLIVTGILIGIGFYGTYKIGGGTMGVVGLVFSIIGMTLGALFIIMGNLVLGYTPNLVPFADGAFYLIPLPIPNSNIFGIGFLIMALAFILIGSASISVREMTQRPSVSLVAGVLSMIGAVFFVIGFFWYVLQIIGFGLIFVAFILWAVVFYSYRNI
jgi:hypothetical protein